MLRLLILLTCLVLCAGTSALAAPAVLDLPAIDPDRLLAADKARGQDGPLRFSEPWDLSLTPGDAEGWERLADGSHRWQLEVRAPGALSLAFGFERFRLPWGGELRITGRSGPQRVYTAADHQDHGQLWTPVVLGDRAVISLTVPAGHRDDHDLELVSVGRGYRFFGEVRAADKQGDCNIDVVCPEGDDWRAEIRSVGVYQIGNTWICSGVMINNTANDMTPYFLTANHCGVNVGNAASVVVYWNFESATCGALSGGNLDDTQSGAIWRASTATTDMSLLELIAPPDTSWHVTYAGWDRTGGTPAAAVAIHHPGTDEKAISFEDDPLERTAYLSAIVNPEATHWRVVDWDLGTTEGGSSGSPLFSPDHRIVGQLHGGYAACDNDLSDWYGRFDLSWLGEGTSEAQLAHWLDSQQTGAMTLDTFDPLNPEGPEEPEEPMPPGAQARVTPVANPVLAGDAALFTVTLASSGQVTLAVHDLRGRLVARLLDEPRAAGTHLAAWPGTGASAGVYVVRLEALGEEHAAAFTRLR